jgi:large subunit ribosomal protein L28
MSGLKCDNCGKGVMFGHNVSHSKRRTQKIFKPNLHQTRVVLDGVRVRKRLCTKCLRMYKKLAKELTATPEVSTQTSA